MIKYIEAYHRLGWAIHFLRPKSKIPIENGWSKGPRKTLESLKSGYRDGYNIGVRLGAASKVGEGFLSAVDVDIKSTDAAHVAEVEEALRRLDVPADAPTVMSGRGGGSKHIYVIVPNPLKGMLLMRSPELVRVYMPSVAPNRRERAEISVEDLKAGIRLRAAWEISFMGEGQQVVLPPSVHPDTLKRYKWSKPFKNLKAAFWVPPKSAMVSPEVARDESGAKFKVVPVDLYGSTLSDNIISQLVDGDGVVDRSSALFGVAIAMRKSGFSEDEILSALTDQRNFLGSVAFDHTGSKDRARAAEWVRRFTLRKAKKAASSADDFDDGGGPVVIDEAKNEALINSDLEDDWKNKLTRKKSGGVERTFENILLILSNCNGPKPFIAYNDFEHNLYWLRDMPMLEVENTPRKIEEVDFIRVRYYLSSKWKMEVKESSDIIPALERLAHRNSFHPVREFLKGLVWDGKPRIDTWLKDYLGASGPDDYLKLVSSKFLLAMVARVMVPGIKFDTILILEGAQGVGKSTCGRILAGEEWFADTHLEIGRGSEKNMAMFGKWVYELGELAAFKTAKSIETLKQFLSSPVDHLRVPYGRRYADFKRQLVFIGTTNQTNYLNDTTGNRRFWPVKVSGALNHKKFEDIRHQLLAEAYFRWCVGNERLWLTKEEDKIADKIRNSRMEFDDIHRAVGEFFKGEVGEKLNEFTLRDFVDLIPELDGIKRDRYMSIKMADSLRRLGYHQKTVRVKGIPCKRWVKKE